MAEYDAHHFVPQFYLRRFSTAESGRSVTTYLLSRGQFIEGASIKKQAQRHRLYGSDEVEKSFHPIEGMGANLFRRIDAGVATLKRGSEDHANLILWTFFQAGRTPAAAQELDDMLTQFGDLLLSANGMTEYRGKIRITQPNGALVSLYHAIHSTPLGGDLAAKLLVTSERPLITSDHPVVLYNSFMETRRKFGSGTGLAVRGLQVFFPISPAICIHLYDFDIYRVGGKSLNSVRITLTNDDVDALNMLQVANAHQQLYAGDGITKNYLDREVSSGSPFRRASRSGMFANPIGVGASGPNSQIVLTHRQDIRCRLSLSCIRETPFAAKYELGNRMAHYRDPAFVQLYESFNKKVAEGGYTPAEWTEFLRDRGYKVR